MLTYSQGVKSVQSWRMLPSRKQPCFGVQCRCAAVGGFAAFRPPRLQHRHCRKLWPHFVYDSWQKIIWYHTSSTLPSIIYPLTFDCLFAWSMLAYCFNSHRLGQRQCSLLWSRVFECASSMWIADATWFARHWVIAVQEAIKVPVLGCSSPDRASGEASVQELLDRQFE